MAKTAKGFTGDRHAPMKSPLAKAERRLIDAGVPHFPSWIGSDHLTLMTIPWSAGLLLAAWLAARSGNRHWLWLSSLMLFLQWFTDSFDGSLGRYRQAGLKLWGYFMDHFLDYVFMACLFGHYAFLVPQPTATLFLVAVPLYGAFEVNSWLEFGATGEFHITYAGVGPTEIRLFFVGVNTAIIFAGTRWLCAALPWFLLFQVALLCVLVYGTQKKLRAMDMANKAATGEG